MSNVSLNVSPEMAQRAYLNILEDMQGEKTAMEEQRIATFNIMEDISEAQEELKKRYGELDALKELVQGLGKSLKTTAVLDRLIQSLKQVLPTSTNLAYVIPSSDPGKPSNLVYVHAVTSLSSKYLDTVKENLVLSFDLLHSRVQRRGELVKWIRNKFLFEFIEGTKDDDKTELPLSMFTVPLLVRDEMLGFVSISSQNSGLFTRQEVNLANTMVSATASTISRLRQLLESEQSRIQSLVESLSNGVVMFDLDKKVTMSNPVAQQMTGLPDKGFYLSEFSKLVTDKSSDKNLLANFETKITQTLETGSVTHVEEMNISRFSYEVFVNPIRDLEKKIIGGAIIMHDITHIKEIDRMKTEFVSVASHQLRTPLTAINWYIEMLQSGDAGELNANQKEFLDEIYQGSTRMVKLINDLLNVSRIETGRLKIEPKPIFLDKLIENIIHEIEVMAKEYSCTVTFNKPKEQLPEIAIDETLMRQVIHNLITNAIRYSPPEQCDIVVTLEQKSDLPAEASAQEGILNPKSEIIISVADQGIGIPKEAQGRIFEKFYRADNAREKEAEGSGIGLYIAKMIAEASGGKLRFESTEGKGTTFYLSIPMKGMLAHEGEKTLTT